MKTLGRRTRCVVIMQLVEIPIGMDLLPLRREYTSVKNPRFRDGL
jgi:hypothetical protein